jgi:hypothetical protein
MKPWYHSIAALWISYFSTSDALQPAFGYHERTGRPMGSHAFIEQLETETERRLHKLPPGRKPKLPAAAK